MRKVKSISVNKEGYILLMHERYKRANAKLVSDKHLENHFDNVSHDGMIPILGFDNIMTCDEMIAFLQERNLPYKTGGQRIVYD